MDILTQFPKSFPYYKKYHDNRIGCTQKTHINISTYFIQKFMEHEWCSQVNFIVKLSLLCIVVWFCIDRIQFWLEHIFDSGAFIKVLKFRSSRNFQMKFLIPTFEFSTIQLNPTCFACSVLEWMPLLWDILHHRLTDGMFRRSIDLPSKSSESSRFLSIVQWQIEWILVFPGTGSRR